MRNPSQPFLVGNATGLLNSKATGEGGGDHTLRKGRRISAMAPRDARRTSSFERPAAVRYSDRNPSVGGVIPQVGLRHPSAGGGIPQVGHRHPSVVGDTPQAGHRKASAVGVIAQAVQPGGRTGRRISSIFTARASPGKSPRLVTGLTGEATTTARRKSTMRDIRRFVGKSSLGRNKSQMAILGHIGSRGGSMQEKRQPPRSQRLPLGCVCVCGWCSWFCRPQQ